MMRPICSMVTTGMVVWLTLCATMWMTAAVHAADPSPAGASNPSGEVGLFRATQEAFRAVSAAVRPSIVRIETVGGSQPSDQRGDKRDPQQPEEEDQGPPPERVFRDALGSSFTVADGPTTGIIYSSDGYIIASSFNFVREPLLISVTFADGRRSAAQLIARDKVRKIALLKVDEVNLPVPIWRDADDVQVGEWAVALGLGFGGDDPSVTVGLVSARNRMHGNAVQTDAKLSPANYGGPLCDIAGRIIGVCVPMAQRPGELAGMEMYDSGVGFAVPKQRVDDIVATLKAGETIHRGWLGISVARGGTRGAFITNLANPSPMLAAGVKPGDRIVWAEGRDVHHFDDLVQAIYMIPAGEQVYLTLERRESPYAVTVSLARNTELGRLAKKVAAPFDPSKPLPIPGRKRRLLPFRK